MSVKMEDAVQTQNIASVKSLTSFGILAAGWLGNDYLDGLSQLLLSFFISAEYKYSIAESDYNKLVNDFAKSKGISFNVSVLKLALKRLLDKKTVAIINGQIIVTIDNVEPLVLSFADQEEEYEKSLLNLVAVFKAYLTCKSAEELTDEECIEYILHFVEGNIITSKTNNKDYKRINNTEIAFLFAEFLEDNENDMQIIGYINTLFVGSQLASSVMNLESNYASNSSLKSLEIYFDTRLILTLLKLQDSFLYNSYENLVKTLNNKKAKLMIFNHTLEEVQKNITTAERVKRLNNYDPSISTPVIDYFIKSSITAEEIRLFSESVPTYLETHFNIIVDYYEFKTEEHIYDDFDLESLGEKMKGLYNVDELEVNEVDKLQSSIDYDVKSIQKVHRKRNGIKSQSLSSSKCIFITTNRIFCSATKAIFYSDNNNNGFSPPCELEKYLSAYVWVGSPGLFSELSKQKIIGKIFAVLKPSKYLLSKFYKIIDEANGNTSLTSELCLVLKHESFVHNYIARKTFNDPDLLHDYDLPDIIDFYKQNVLKDERDKWEKIVTDNEVEIEFYKESIGSKEQIINNMQSGINRLIFVTNSICLGILILLGLSLGIISIIDFVKSGISVYNTLALIATAVYYWALFKVICKKLNGIIEKKVRNYFQKNL